MGCIEFQALLPFVIDDELPAEMNGHLHTCQRCYELVSDIEFIVEQTKLLMPLLDPSPELWQRIRERLNGGLQSRNKL
jgi:hypothetical protein